MSLNIRIAQWHRRLPPLWRWVLEGVGIAFLAIVTLLFALFLL